MQDLTRTSPLSARLSSAVYLLYSAVGETDLQQNLGRAEYSYFFVREIFRRALEKHAQVIVISDPLREVDRIVRDHHRRGINCIFLSFAPPHRTFLDVSSATIPVFAWEFDTLPDEVWDDEPRNDWRWVLARIGCAITHSKYSADVIRTAMGADFPVTSIPAPLWDTARQASQLLDGVPQGETELAVNGTVLDTRSWPGQEKPDPPAAPARKGFTRRLRLSISLAAVWYREVVADLLPVALRGLLSRAARTGFARIVGQRDQSSPPADAAAPARAGVRITKEEIVYTSVFNPYDGRKNWHDMLTAFCTALASKTDATLILKFVHHDCSSALAEARAIVPRLPRHCCRVIVMAGFLDDDAYRALLARTAFVTNSSMSEGQCLPLMEFMSCGKPAVAPRNTAMEEYIDEQVAFVVDSSPELCCWPQDSRNVFRARRYRINWESLGSAFRDSYRMAREDPASYVTMARRATARLRDHCSEEVALSRLSQFLRLPGDVERSQADDRGTVVENSSGAKQ